MCCFQVDQWQFGLVMARRGVGVALALAWWLRMGRTCLQPSALPVLLARLLFACWVDICLSARRTCPVAAGTSLNLDPSLSPATVFSDRNICARKHSFQFVCRLLGRESRVKLALVAVLVARG